MTRRTLLGGLSALAGLGTLALVMAIGPRPAAAARTTFRAPVIATLADPGDASATSIVSGTVIYLPLIARGPQVERVKIEAGDRYLIVEFLDDDLVHFELSAVGTGPDIRLPIPTTPMIDKHDYLGPSRFSDDGNGTWETASLRVQVDANELCVTVTDLARQPPLTLTTICPLDLERDWKGIALSPEAFTHVYGLGQQFTTPGAADGDWVGRVRSSSGQFGNTIEAWNGGQVGNTQFPIAYFLGADLDSYALFIDSPYKQRWDFTGQRWTAKLWGDWLRFYVLTGPDLQDLRHDYLELTGRPPVPPKKMFGLWLSEYGFDNWAELNETLSTLRSNHFPVDGFLLDIQWFGGVIWGSPDSPMGTLAWDVNRFPNPSNQIARLRDEQGAGVMLIEESYIARRRPEHAAMANYGYLARDCETCGPTFNNWALWWGKGGMIDWTNDAAAAFWHDWKREPLVNAGVIGHWTDLGEPWTYSAASWYWGLPGDRAPLHDHRDIHNLFNLKWSQSIVAGYARNGHAQRPFILSRSGTSGSQHYGVALWSADIGSNLSSLATHLNTQLHLSLSGVDYYGADIGGFYRSALDGDLGEMYTRWFANGLAFDIPARPHTENLCNCNETAPDRVGHLASNLDNVRQRYELIPYLYSLAHRAYLYGDPVIPPLAYVYQTDPQVRELGSEKLIGRDLLVAAVTTYTETERAVYLPAGDWVDYHTNEWIHSADEWTGPFPVFRDGKFKLPMFARAGAIIPHMHVDDRTMNAVGRRTDGTRRDELIVNVYVDRTPSQFTLYEDDGETLAYQNGALRTTLISQALTEDAVAVTIGSATGTYAGALSTRNNVVKLIVNDPGAATGVSLNGNPLTQYATRTEFDAATAGWIRAGNNLIMAKSGDVSVLDEKLFLFSFPSAPNVPPGPQVPTQAARR
jgi:alpha-glucosidase